MTETAYRFCGQMRLPTGYVCAFVLSISWNWLAVVRHGWKASLVYMCSCIHAHQREKKAICTNIFGTQSEYIDWGMRVAIATFNEGLYSYFEINSIRDK